MNKEILLSCSRPARALLALVLLTVSVFAAEPRAVISGQTTAPAPGVIVLSSQGSAYDVGELIWLVADDKVQCMEGKDGRLALFYMNPTPISTKVLLVTFGSVDGQPKAAIATQAVSFGVVPPGPNPPPPVPPPGPNPPPVPPPPGPAPDLPDGRFKLAALAYSSAMLVPQPARARAVSVAAAFSNISAGIANGSITTVDQASAQTKAASTKAFDSDLTPWLKFTVPVVAQVNNLRATGQMNTLQDLAVAWNEIALGTKQAQ